ncbi:MAG: hypothetical protein ABEJ24_01285 [Candidatus Magasanikbacteria bacterium]
MRKEDNDVQVKGPAVQELEEKGSCLKRSCGKGCFFIILLIISFLGLIKFASSPHLKEVKKVPKSLPEGVPVYEQDSISRIAVASQNNKTFLAKVSDIVPKFFLVSAHVILQEDSPVELKNYLNAKDSTEKKNIFSEFLYLMNQPTKKRQNKIVIEWRNISAEPDFVKDFYTTELKKNGFTVNSTADKKDIKQIGFSKGGIVGSLYLENNPEQPGTEIGSLDIVIPNK